MPVTWGTAVRAPPRPAPAGTAHAELAHGPGAKTGSPTGIELRRSQVKIVGQTRPDAGRSKWRGGHFPRSGTKQRLEPGLGVSVGQPRRNPPFLTHDHRWIPYGGSHQAARGGCAAGARRARGGHAARFCAVARRQAPACALSAERLESGADLLGRAPVVVELGDHGQVLAQLDEGHPGSPVIVQAGQLRVYVEEPLRLRRVR